MEYTAVINEELQRELLEYCTQRNIQSGIIFADNEGKIVSKEYFSNQLRRLAEDSEINKGSVSIHSFRDLFIRNASENLKKQQDEEIEDEI